MSDKFPNKYLINLINTHQEFLTKKIDFLDQVKERLGDTDNSDNERSNKLKKFLMDTMVRLSETKTK